MDWDALFNEFCQSNLSLKDFLISKKINATSGNSKKQTRGWSTRRARIKHEINEETQKKIIKKTIKKKTEELITCESVALDLLKMAKKLKIDNTRDYKSLTSALKDISDILKKDEDQIIEEEETDNLMKQIMEIRNGKEDNKDQ